MHILAARGATAALVLSLAQRHATPLMGGFEQKNYGKEGARISLLVPGGSLPASDVPPLCQGKDLTGVIYELSGGRLELVAEGGKQQLEELVGDVQAAAGEAAALREAWQLPVGGYVAQFPVVTFDASKMRAKISMTGDAGDLDYISRHLQIEAVFNRGLSLSKNRPTPELMELDAKGDALRLKSFVRWCYQGPPLARPEEMKVEWSSAA